LTAYVKDRKKTLKEIKTTLPWDRYQAEEIERGVASSFFCVVILSKDYLNWPGVKFALECIVKYEKNYQIIHDADNSPFQLPPDSPSLDRLFEEKVPSYLRGILLELVTHRSLFEKDCPGDVHSLSG
jgi:hypothetical protein